MERIADEGVTDVFMVTGGGSIFLNDAVALNKRLNGVFCHHEIATTIAAEAYQRVKGGIGVALVTSGPGGTNAITGTAGAWLDSVPQLVISGQSFSKQTIGNTGTRQIGVQEINIIDMVKPITKYAVMVTDANEIRYHLEKALYLAKNGRPGPVWLDIPGDVQKAEINPASLPAFNPEEVASVKDSELRKKVRAVAAALVESKRPLFHIGQGVRLAGGERKLFEILERFGIPFVTARNANDIAPSDHPLFAGRPGTFAQRGANFAVQTCDVYVAVGTRLSLPQVSYNSKDFARNALKVMVDIDKTELEKPTLNIDLKIQSDAKEFLELLSEELQGASITCSSWAAKCREWRARYPVCMPEHKEHRGTVHTYHFTEELSDVLGSSDIVVTDMGVAFQGTHQVFRVKKGQRLFTNCGLASMGWGLPAAVGACIASGRKRTTLITGDGSFMMTSHELAVIMHLKLPIKIFLYNNGGYLTIKQTQEMGFNGNTYGVNPETGLSFPNFIKLAEAHEIPTYQIKDHTNLKQHLEKVLNAPGPLFCEVISAPDQVQGPRAINRRNPDGTFNPTPLEDLYPFLDSKEIEDNMRIIKE
jgi:acetolactate synthase-1/2/3 large subunit